ncbi:hypothetical protein KAR10_10040, partial [bacterium]|nr:hypothetical protein [bacterium]
MMKRIIAGIFILFISFHGNASAKQTEDMGFVLLDRVLFKFKELGRSGAIDSKPLHDLLDECYKKAKKAKGEDTIDLIFFNRYQKLLIAIRLATSKDSTEMLKPILIKTINGFETTDESNRLTKSMSKSKKIYLISGAIIREMTDLRLYLEKNAHRSQLFKKTMLLGNLFQGKNKNIWYVKGNKKPFSGVAIAKYSDGTLKEKTNFKNGIMEGSRFLYHNNGLIAAEGNMTNNVKSGLWTYYNYEGELEKIIRCNHKLRFYTRRFFHESRLGNPSKALNYLKKAIGISPLKALKKKEENFALHMRDDCFYAKRLDCSLKYAKIWVNQVIQSSQFNNKEKANAHEILGFLYWQKSQKGKGKMNPGEIIKLIDNSIEAFKKGIEYYRISTAAHGYLDILYTGKADLDPQNREKYLALAQKNRKTFAILLQKVKVKNQQETKRFLESLDEMKPKKVSRDKPATEESINAYQI